MLAIGKKLDSPLGLFHLGSCSFSLNFYKTSLVKFNVHLNGQILHHWASAWNFYRNSWYLHESLILIHHQQGNLTLLLTKITPPEGSIRTWDELWFSFRVFFIHIVKIVFLCCDCAQIYVHVEKFSIRYHCDRYIINMWNLMDDIQWMTKLKVTGWLIFLRMVFRDFSSSLQIFAFF